MHTHVDTLTYFLSRLRTHKTILCALSRAQGSNRSTQSPHTAVEEGVMLLYTSKCPPDDVDRIICSSTGMIVVRDAAEQIQAFMRSRVLVALLRLSSCRLREESLLWELLLLSYISSNQHFSSHLRPWLQGNAVCSTCGAHARRQVSFLIQFLVSNVNFQCLFGALLQFMFGFQCVWVGSEQILSVRNK